MRLALSAAQLDLVIDDPTALLIAFREDEGIHYLDHYALIKRHLAV